MDTWPAVYDPVFSRLDGLKRTAHGWQARCPAHDDRHPSLSLRVAEDDGRLLVRCHRGKGDGGGEGCSAAEIMAALDLSLGNLFADQSVAQGPLGKTPKGIPEAIYRYRDEYRMLLFEVLRYRLPDGKKDFRQRRPDLNGKCWIWNLDGVRRVLYRLPEVLRALTEDPFRRLVVVEGEKAANALWAIGVPATCAPGGAGKWQLADRASVLHVFGGQGGARVVVCPDNDPYDPRRKGWAGQEHAEEVCRALYPIAAEVKYLDLPGLPLKGDAYDWVQGLRERFLCDKAKRFWSLVAAVPLWQPPDQPHPFAARMEQLARGAAIFSHRDWIRQTEDLLTTLHDTSLAADRPDGTHLSPQVDAAVRLAAWLQAGCETFLGVQRQPRSLPKEGEEPE
jgi:hypothetical protein